MRILATLFLLCALLGAVAQDIPGTVVAAKVTTGSTNNTFSIGDAIEMKGTTKHVNTALDMTNIPPARREIGMDCYIVQSNLTFRLIGGIADANWSLVQFGNATNAVYAQVATNAINATNFWGSLSPTNLPVGLSSSNYVGAFTGNGTGLTNLSLTPGSGAAYATNAYKAILTSTLAQAVLGIDGAFNFTVTALNAGMVGAQPTAAVLSNITSSASGTNQVLVTDGGTTARWTGNLQVSNVTATGAGGTIAGPLLQTVTTGSGTAPTLQFVSSDHGITNLQFFGKTDNSLWFQGTALRLAGSSKLWLDGGLFFTAPLAVTNWGSLPLVTYDAVPQLESAGQSLVMTPTLGLYSQYGFNGDVSQTFNYDIRTAKPGTLAAAINALGTNYTPNYTNALLVNSTNLGTFTITDGGSNVFQWTAANNVANANGSISANNYYGSNVIVFNVKTNLNVLEYGATGNGITDDTAALRAAFNYCTNTSGVTVYMPPGTYKVTGSIDIPWTVATPNGDTPTNGTTILGERSSTTIDCSTCTNAVFRFNATPGFYPQSSFSGLQIKGIRFYKGQNLANTTNQAPIIMVYNTQTNADNVPSTVAYYEDLQFEGGYMQVCFSNVTVVNQMFNRCKFFTFVNRAVYMSRSDSPHFTHCFFSSDKQIDAWASKAPALEWNTGVSLMLTNRQGTVPGTGDAGLGGVVDNCEFNCLIARCDANVGLEFRTCDTEYGSNGLTNTAAWGVFEITNISWVTISDLICGIGGTTNNSYVHLWGQGAPRHVIVNNPIYNPQNIANYPRLFIWEDTIGEGPFQEEPQWTGQDFWGNVANAYTAKTFNYEWRNGAAKAYYYLRPRAQAFSILDAQIIRQRNALSNQQITNLLFYYPGLLTGGTQTNYMLINTNGVLTKIWSDGFNVYGQEVGTH